MDVEPSRQDLLVSLADFYQICYYLEKFVQLDHLLIFFVFLISVQPCFVKAEVSSLRGCTGFLFPDFIVLFCDGCRD